MFDPIKAVRTILLADTEVASLVSTNIFGEVLPEHYDPSVSPALVISARGGRPHSEINQFVLSRQVYFAIVTALFNQQNISFGSDGKMVSCTEESVGQDMVDTNTGWAMTLSHFSVTMAATKAIPGPAIVDEAGFAVEFGGYL